MHSKLSRRSRLRALALAVPAAALLFVVAGPGLAGAADTAATTTAPTDVITIELVNQRQLKFVAPETVTKGDQLEIINKTNPRQVGPHTFSLVTKGSVPKTPQARKNCFTPKHICLSVANWHGFNPKTEKIRIDPVKAGAEGWSTLGSTTKKGDSWFTEKPGDHISQEVSASAPSTLYFICAVHPWMHGQVKVLPAPTS